MTHQHKHILMPLTISPVHFYYPQGGHSVGLHLHGGKDNESAAARSLAHFANGFSVHRPQVCAQVYEAHEGARLQREECVWCSPHHSCPALWFSTPPVFTAGPLPPQDTLSGPGERGFYKILLTVVCLHLKLAAADTRQTSASLLFPPCLPAFV